MGTQYIYYIESNVICLIIFAILFFHDLFGVDRQEKQIKYDHTLIAFMLYFISDSVWAAVEDGLIPTSNIVALITNTANFILMSTVTFLWLRYVMAVEGVKNRERPINKVAVLFPFFISLLACIVIYLINPYLLIDEECKVTILFNIMITIVPIIYVVAVLIYSIGRAVKEENPMQRRLHYYVGLFPLIVVLGGVLQFVFPNAPVFCFSCTILMITYFIHSMDTQISTDPLTQLNNRGQLSRYTSQTSKLFIEGRKTYVVMLDINDFKVINDTFGHAEGDHALIMVADALKFVEKSNDVPMFICRYGGDEFIMIVNPVDEREIDKLISDIRSRIDYECKLSETNYKISIGAGYDELLGSNDNVQKCMLRADKKLYIDKEKLKLGQKEG